MRMVQGAAFRVLACFNDSDTRNFVELCDMAGYPTDLGGYYIRQLLDGEYLQKTGRGQYQILPKGKQQLAFYQGKLFAIRPRLNVAVIARQGESMVVIRRQVQPFIGAAEWPAGAVAAGEDLQPARQSTVGENLLQPAGQIQKVDNPSRSLLDIFDFVAAEEGAMLQERVYNLTPADLAMPQDADAQP
jgi:hypothetical protein